MHPIQSHREYLAQERDLNSLKGGKSFMKDGFLGRWFGNASRHWERRKMIATLEAMDDRLLRDIGVFRGEIPRLVDGLLRFEQESAAMAPPAVQAERYDPACCQAA